MSGHKSRAERARTWIEHFCIVPSGPERGQYVRLTRQQRDTLTAIYDEGRDDAASDVSGPLAAYLLLLHLCGPEAIQQEQSFRPAVGSDLFTLWNAVGPDLCAVLKRDGPRIVCPELGTAFPPTAA
jgi:hypothetical protein